MTDLNIQELVEGLNAAGLVPTIIEELPPSPYIPGTEIQFAWDSTCLTDLKTCPRLYQLQRIEGWRPKRDNVHLRFGIEVHLCVQDYEKLRHDGCDHEEALFHVISALMQRIDDWRPEAKNQFDAAKYKNRGTLVRSVICYLDKYQDDPAKTVILPNGKPAVELSFRLELDYAPRGCDQPYMLCGHLDRLVEFQGAVFNMDYKTTKYTLDDNFFKKFDIDNQMTLYTFASKVLFQIPLKGVIVNGIQSLIEGSRATRSVTYRTDDQIKEWLADLQILIEQAEGYARQGYWPMNDTACDQYGGCKFRDVCSKSPGVREKFLKADFVKDKPWNPLETR